MKIYSFFRISREKKKETLPEWADKNKVVLNPLKWNFKTFTDNVRKTMKDKP